MSVVISVQKNGGSGFWWITEQNVQGWKTQS